MNGVINQLPPPLPPELASLPPAPRKFSKPAVAGFVLAALALPLCVVLPVALFHHVVEGMQEQAAPIFLGLFVAAWIGFLAAIFGAVALRRMRGPTPEFRGRPLALITTAGTRAALLGTALGFAAIPLAGAFAAMHGARGAPEGAVKAAWWIGLLLVVWYVGAMIRRARRPARGDGWGAFTCGIVFHLLLIVAVPASMVSAIFTLNPPAFDGRQTHRRYDGFQVNGLYAMCELSLDLPAAPETTLTLRLWEKGRGKDLASLKGSGSASYRWTLAEAPMSGHTLAWSTVGRGGSSESRSLDLPSSLDLIPTGDRMRIPVAAGTQTNLWLFLPYEAAGTPPAADATPEWGVELVISAGDPPSP